MEFLSITLQGFLSYYKETVLDFSEGTTVIIGLNNSGKSKLFDAINWAMYERVYDSTSRLWIDMPDKISKIVLNNRAAKEALASKGKAEARVCLELKAEDYEDKTLMIERIYSYDFSSGSSKNVPCEKKIRFSVIDDITGNAKPYVGEDASLRINSLCSLKIRDFVLFKGEIADDLLQLSKTNQTAIVEAVREVSRLELFEKATTIANKYSNSKYHVLTRLSSASKSTEEKKNIIEAKIKALENEKAEEEEKRNKCDELISSLANQMAKQKAILSDQEDLAILFQQKDQLKRDKEQFVAQLKNYNEINKSISDTWVFYKVRDKINSFSDFYKQLELQGHVPAPFSQSVITKSLLDHRCALCGCELTEGSHCREEVKKKVQNELIDGLGKTLSNINYFYGNKLFDINRVPDSIKEYTKTKENQEKQKRFIEEQIVTLQKKIDSVQISSTDEAKKQKLEEVKHLYSLNEASLSKAKLGRSYAQGQIDRINTDIEKYKKEILNLVASTTKIDEMDKAKLYYARKLSEAMTKLCADAQELAYSEIERAANMYYHEMLKNNPAMIGNVKIDKANSEIYTENDFGDKIDNINEGNRVAIQLAVTAGILTVAGNQFSSYYPFVTDAPTSAMDASNKRTTINCMIDAFEQSIIIVKDDSDEDAGIVDSLYATIKESSKIDKAYRLRLYCEPGGSIEDQYTVVEVIK